MKKIDSVAGGARAVRSVRALPGAFAGGVMLALLAACSLEPTYKRPDVETPSAFKEAPVIAPQDAGTWKPAQPADAAQRGQWWTMLGHATLNWLQEQALAASQDLKAPAPRVRESRASLDTARSAWFPRLDPRLAP